MNEPHVMAYANLQKNPSCEQQEYAAKYEFMNILTVAG